MTSHTSTQNPEMSPELIKSNYNTAFDETNLLCVHQPLRSNDALLSQNMESLASL